MTVTLTDILRQDRRERIILVELDYMAEDAGAPVTRTLYFSTSSRVTYTPGGNLTAGDGSPTGPYVIYEDCINSVPQFSRSISGPIGSTYSSSLGSLEIDNADGDKDFMLGIALDGSEARFYLLDSGVKYLVFKAIALRVATPSVDRISVTLKDAGVLLNKSVGGTVVIGGTGPNADQWRPFNFGYVHNLEAKVYDSPGLIYVHSDTGVFTTAVDVRDRGVSVVFTDNADGTFTLDASPAGIITCDVVSSYDGTDPTRRVSDLLQLIVGDRQLNNQGQGFSSAGSTFTIGDADDYLIGLSIGEARNIVDVLNQVCDSGNCFWAIKRTGEFTYGRLRPNNIEDFGFISASITDDDWDQGTWRVEHDPPGYYKLQAYMSRNWYRQTDFAGSLLPDEMAIFTRPGIFLLQDDAAGTAYADIPEAYHKTLSISPALDTILSGGFDELDLPYLSDWMETRRFMQLPWIERLSITVGLEWYYLELGDPVEVISPRFGLDGGVLFQVISININLSQAKIDLILLRRHPAEPLPPGWTRVTASIDPVPPRLALKSFISGPPPGSGGGSPEICGWLFAPGRGWYFVPCGGGGGGPVVYSYRMGGPGWFVNPMFLNSGNVLLVDSVDPFNTPPWWAVVSDGPSGQKIVVDQTAVNAATGDTGADIYIQLLTAELFATPPVASDSFVRPLSYPVTVGNDGTTIPDVRFEDSSTSVTSLFPFPGDVDYGGTIIDYSGKTPSGRITELRVPVAGATTGDLDVFIESMQVFANYDAPGYASISAALIFGFFNLNTISLVQGHLLITVQNNSGSTINAMNIPKIYLPTDAVDPDTPTGTEFDVSFLGATTATCTINSAGITPTVGGDRHELNFSFTGASIADGDIARFVLPIEVRGAGSITGYPDVLLLQPAFNGTITVTPSVPFKVFMESYANPPGSILGL